MVTYNTWTQSGNALWDYAIDGVPYLAGQNREFPYQREAKSPRAQQISEGNVGERSLQNWWYRSQQSFHLGAGSVWHDPSEYGQYRFADSEGIDPWTPGELKLLPKCTKVVNKSAGNVTGDNAILKTIASTAVNGVIIAEAASTYVRFYAADGTITNITGISNGVHSVATSSKYVWIGTADAVWRVGVSSLTGGSVAATQIYTFVGFASVTGSRMEWAKERLWLGFGRYLWALTGAPGSTPTALSSDDTQDGEIYPIFVHPDENWLFSSITSVVDGVMASGWGYYGDKSSIYYVAWDKNTDDYTTPVVVADMPDREEVRSIQSYLGVYLLMTTTKGFRVGLVRQSGVVEVGPIIINGMVNDVAVEGDFCWVAMAGGITDPPEFGRSGSASAKHSDDNTKCGLFRIDLSRTVEPNIGRFAWARDLIYDYGAWCSASAVAHLGNTGRLVFWMETGDANSGLIAQHATELVSEGVLETGKIRFDTLEQKNFYRLKTLCEEAPGNIEVSWRDEGCTVAVLDSFATDSLREYECDASDGSPHQWVSYRFRLYQDSSEDNPAMTGYQVRAWPAMTVDRTIQVPLLCFDREKPFNGPVVERPVWDRVAALERLQEQAKVVVFQDLGTGEYAHCLVEGVQFVSSVIPVTVQGRQAKGGMLVVTLRQLHAGGNDWSLEAGGV